MLLRSFHIIALPLLLFGVMACAKKQSQLPIPEEKLVDILVDVHTAEAAISFLYGEKRDTFAENYYEDIYTIHDISSDEFDQTMKILRSDPEMMVRVYQGILDQVDEQVSD